MLDLRTVAADLGLPDGQKLTGEFWAQSMATLPDGTLPFLSEAFIASACTYAQLPAPIPSALISAAGRLETRPAARALIWHAHCLLASEQASIHEWPDPIPAIGIDSGAFFLLAALSLADHARQIHGKLGIPPDIARDTMGDLLQHVERYKFRHGVYGAMGRQAGQWLPLHFHGRLYRLGRLNFRLLPWQLPARAFRWRGTGTPRDVDNQPLRRVIMLAGGGQVFRRDGQVNGSGGVTESDGIWTSTFAIDDLHIRGHAIDPAAAAAGSRQLCLDASHWKRILQAGDQLLDIHIPETGPLDFDQCRDALAQAREFFPRYFPASPPAVAWYCASWLLDPQLEKYLPPTANIVRFSREFYRLPVKSGPSTTTERLLGGPPRDASAVPRQTTLQRALVEHVRLGGHWRNAAAVLFLEDFDWGRQVYLQAV